MQHVTGKAYHQRKRFETLRDLLVDTAERFGDADAYRFHPTPGAPDEVRSYRTFLADIQAVGTALLARGLAGTHIVVVGANCYEWAVAHNAVISGVGVSVPLDRQLPEPEVIDLTARGRAEAFFYHPGHRAIATAVAAANPNVRLFIQLKDDAEQALPAGDDRFVRLADLLADGQRRMRDGDRRLVDAPIDAGSMAALLFTSGTTALSKGVMLSHRNIAANVHSVCSTIDIPSGQRALSVLPLHHTFENTVGMYVLLTLGICICFTDGLRYLANNLKEWRIHVLLGVPLLFENIYNQIQKTLVKTGKKKLVDRMIAVSSVLLRIGIDLRPKLFHRIIEGVGGALSLCVSGAAAIDPQIIRFFRGIGIEFLAGYGLTETSPVISACNFQVNVEGSVGPPLAFIDVAIDTDTVGGEGEILTRSACVMLGYYDNETATSETITADGWLRTGDIGRLDSRGCLYITGRVKSMIVLPNGKKAFPEEIEFLLDRIEGVKESMVWGDTARGLVDISAKMVIDPEALPEDAAASPQHLSAYFDEQIRQINRSMPAYKAIKYYILSEQDLIKTTTLKVKRVPERQRIEHTLSEQGLTLRGATGRKLD